MFVKFNQSFDRQSVKAHMSSSNSDKTTPQLVPWDSEHVCVCPTVSVFRRAGLKGAFKAQAYQANALTQKGRLIIGIG